MRNASGLTAADLAHAQGFQECAETLSNAQNFQQNMALSHNGTSQNGGLAQQTIQGRSILNGVPNRKRSFDGREVNPVKKVRMNEMQNGNWPLGVRGEPRIDNITMEFSATVTSGLGMPAEMLNGNGPHGGGGEPLINSINMEFAVTSGGPGSYDRGDNGLAPAQVIASMDQSDPSLISAAKELEVFTVASMQTPCRCTNSYAYL